MEKKKVIVIGAGIAGLTAGIYLLDNGFDVTIYEKHTVPGGECTGWRRDGLFIDGCAHWIVGTNKNSELYPLWKHICAINDDSIIHNTEFFTKLDINGEIITIYSDLNKLYNELTRVAPEDKKIINKFIKGIKSYSHVLIPVEKPIDYMNIFELTKYGFHSLPMLSSYLKYHRMSVQKFASKCKSKTLKRIFCSILSTNYNMHSLLYTMQALAKNDAGIVEGGSLALALRVKDKFTSLGGKIVFDSNVNRINIFKNKATSITLNNGDIINADYIVPACDIHYTLFNLLDNKYNIPFINNKFKDVNKYPLCQAMLCSYKINKDISMYPKMIQFDVMPIKIHEEVISNITLRNYSFDNKLNTSSTCVTVLIQVKDSLYDYFKGLSKEDYIKEKNRIGNEVLNHLIRYYKLDKDDAKLIDVTTPLTYERYCNAYRGSYMSFITSKDSKGLMHSGKIKGLKNVILAGQWLMPPGGLPIALFTGKHAAMRICKLNKIKFKNLEN